ncbi:peptidoglycan DD-metalloendopeptidase family protein [Bacillus sp. FJAT-29790]|uniref:murein hydrolase activator EnvC family protein n=1 Tax=Bacillus sp. FJAT-29790 TaxID=1895002 RepID=UPI001C2478F7|nr:peptidoglycan DD-metalloendopeptidase family protein [Bacillus sp. FJAT-29790]MBU8879939.1 peptidoglycan DD-metalloendopeptidase family protein [Bacillus sp. FJAT-29790]
MKRKLLILGIGLMMGLGSLFSPAINTAYAVQVNKQLENQKANVQSKRSNVQSEINQKKNKVTEINAEQAAVGNEIKKLDFAVADTSSQIREKEAQIEEAKQEIERLQKEIEVLKEQIKKRDELLKERVRSIQENGGVISYVDVLLGSQSFGDFINRVSAVTSFMQADKDLIKMHQEDKALLDSTEAEVKEQLNQLSKKLADLEGMKKKLDGQIAEKNKLLTQLKHKEEEMHEELHELEDEEAILAAQEKAIKREIEAWNKRQRELEEERKRQAAVAAKAKANGSSSSSSVAPAPVVTNGVFMNPTTGRLTSHYGQRWGTLHSGIDIGKGGRSGAVPVVASASGTVIRANYDRSYGNVVMITHYIDGQVMTTVYGHLENLFVSNGQRVEKGQLVGYMGNTGNSTGPHLHFEIHIGPWNGARSNSVNPLKYVSY